MFQHHDNATVARSSWRLFRDQVHVISHKSQGLFRRHQILDILVKPSKVLNVDECLIYNGYT